MADTALERLITAVHAHYDAPNATPLLLSSFGQKNKPLLADLKAEFGSLMAAVRAAGEDKIRVVDATSGREAVAPASIATTLQQQIQTDTASQRRDANLFDCLPPAVKLAFCVRTEAGEQVAIDTVRPFRFTKVTTPELIRPTQRIIGEEYRRPGLTLRTASLTEREALWRNFISWAEATGIDPNTFQQGEATTALARLIAAQPADIIPRLIIPADIAQILLKHS